VKPNSRLSTIVPSAPSAMACLPPSPSVKSPLMNCRRHSESRALLICPYCWLLNPNSAFNSGPRCEIVAAQVVPAVQQARKNSCGSGAAGSPAVSVPPVKHQVAEAGFHDLILGRIRG